MIKIECKTELQKKKSSKYFFRKILQRRVFFKILETKRVISENELKKLENNANEKP